MQGNTGRDSAGVPGAGRVRVCEHSEESDGMSKCNDNYTGKDKMKHFGACLALAIINPIVAVVVAVAKEVHDERTDGNHWCWKDIVADVAGIVLGSVVHLLVL